MCVEHYNGDDTVNCNFACFNQASEFYILFSEFYSFPILTLLSLKWIKFYGVLSVLSAIGSIITPYNSFTGFSQAWKEYLNLDGFLEKSLKTLPALKSTWILLIGFEKLLKFTNSIGPNSVMET